MLIHPSQFECRDLCPAIPEMICNELFVSSSGASAVETDSVMVMEGDVVILYTADIMNQQDRMTWFFGVNRIAAINGDQSMVCTDDWCTERFRDRLKLDHQTGSLTIMNIRNTDSGEYKLKITSRNTGNIFSVTVHGESFHILKPGYLCLNHLFNVLCFYQV